MGCEGLLDRIGWRARFVAACCARLHGVVAGVRRAVGCWLRAGGGTDGTWSCESWLCSCTPIKEAASVAAVAELIASRRASGPGEAGADFGHGKAFTSNGGDGGEAELPAITAGGDRQAFIGDEPFPNDPFSVKSGTRIAL